MERAVLSSRIISILSDISRLNNALYALNSTDIQRYPDNYETLSIDAALRAERIACQLRHLVYATTRIPKHEYLESAAEVQGIEIKSGEGILEITLPGLLPKRKQSRGAEYLLDPFTAALTQYAQDHPLPQFHHCVVCFSQVYCKELPLRRVRDYDNLELKQFLDVAASFVLADDTGLLCDVFHSTELGEKDCTRITIMDSRHFQEWLDSKMLALESFQEL